LAEQRILLIRTGLLPPLFIYSCLRKNVHQQTCSDAAFVRVGYSQFQASFFHELMLSPLLCQGSAGSLGYRKSSALAQAKADL